MRVLIKNRGLDLGVMTRLVLAAPGPHRGGLIIPSNLAGRDITGPWQMGTQHLCKVSNEGSNPFGSTQRLTKQNPSGGLITCPFRCWNRMLELPKPQVVRFDEAVVVAQLAERLV